MIPDSRRMQIKINLIDETLLSCIKKTILPTTTILSDCRKAYDGIERLEEFHFKHLEVNHSENFVGITTNAHTQGVESLWNQEKRRNRRQYGIHFSDKGLYDE